MQGVAFVERLCFDYVDLLGAPADGELTLTGGATASRAWCQLRADVLGRPVRLVEQPEAAVGMAILAAAASRRALASAAGAMVRTREVIEPRSARAPQLLEALRAPRGGARARGWLGAELAQHARSGRAADASRHGSWRLNAGGERWSPLTPSSAQSWAPLELRLRRLACGAASVNGTCNPQSPMLQSA